MELTNALYLAAPPPEPGSAPKPFDGPELASLREALEALTLLLAPFAPHLAEECWSLLGRKGLLAGEAWPAIDPALLRSDKIEIVVQVNGRLRGKVAVSSTALEEEVITLALSDAKLAEHMRGGVVRTIFVPGKLLNLVVRGEG